jgi:hypothetical protein
MWSVLTSLRRLLFPTGNGCRKPPSRRTAPRLETLEERTVPQATPATDPFLFTPIPDFTPLKEHIHEHLTILINGKQRVVPALIGARLPDGFLPIHTHDTTGIIHVETTVVRPFTLGDFFAVWGKPFNSQQILGRQVDANHKIVMTVNGRVRKSFDNWVLHNHDDIVISYQLRSKPAPRLTPYVWPPGF